MLRSLMMEIICQDHFAITCKFNGAKLSTHGCTVTKSKADCGYRLQWEKDDNMFYQTYLNSELSSIAIPVDASLCRNAYYHNHCIGLECF